MPKESSNGTNPPSIILSSLQSCDQLVVETLNSTYVFLWDSLYSSRLIQCSNTNIDLGEVHLLGSYAAQPSLEATGQLRVGESMLYSFNSPLPEQNGTPAVWTSSIVNLRYHRPTLTTIRPAPGLRQPQSRFHQNKLDAQKQPSEDQKFEGSPVLWTPYAPKIPRSFVSSELVSIDGI